MGLGGAGKAILCRAVFTELAEIILLQRKSSIEKNKAFVQKVERETGREIRLGSYEEDLPSSLEKSDILVNATNIGMLREESLLPDRTFLHAGLFVSDCIYHPMETKFLLQAKEQGLATMNGLPMLFYQAAEAFRLWTGKEMPEEIFGILEDAVRE